MEERKWENMEMDCLVNVFGRVGMESLLLDVPFVCKSWHKASLNPLCWRRLVFPRTEDDPLFDDDFIGRFVETYRIDKFSVTAFIKFIVDRSCGKATVVIFRRTFSVEAMKYVADTCPDLTILGMGICSYLELPLIALEVIPKFKNMVGLMLQNSYYLKEILVQVSINCKNFEGLRVDNARFNEDEASAVVTLIPNVKYLFLRRAYIETEDLETILRGCKELVQLDVRNCIGFEADEKILELASQIKTFKHAGSRLYDDSDDYWAIDHDSIYDDYLSD